MYKCGFAKSDITCWEPEIAMLGWGQFHNRVGGVAVPLMARAVVIEDPNGGRLAYVCADLLLISDAVRQEVVAQLEQTLGLDDHQVVLTATHTHSGPSGFSHYFWKNLASPGFSQHVFDGIVDGIVDATTTAWNNRVDATLRMAQEALPTLDGISFNRSWHAYSMNEDVEPVSFERREEATDRVMTVLRFDDVHDQPIGVLVWFAVHGTCVHADNHLLHPDNKGLAANALEDSGEGAPPFAIFAQEATGDVTPNYRWSDDRGVTIGRHDDDFESAEFVASVQVRHARRLFDVARTNPALDGPVDGVFHYVDFSSVEIDPGVDPSGRGHRTRAPHVGISMAQGTAEGPGPLLEAKWVCKLLNGLAGRTDQLRSWVQPGYQRRFDPSYPLLGLSRGNKARVAGIIPLSKRVLPPVNPALRYARQLLNDRALDHPEFVPVRLPVQLVRIGPIAVVAASFEVTTVSGRRLRATLEPRLVEQGVDTIIVNSYANAYTGYLTTFEEYQVQAYEGGYTLFGPWSLGALRTIYAGLAEELGRPVGTRRGGASPFPVPLDEVKRRPFHGRWPDLATP